MTKEKQLTRAKAIAVLECMAIDLTGALATLKETDPMTDVLRQRLEAIDTAQAALREQLPCKPGDTVYRLCGQRGHKYVAERKVISVSLCGNQSWQILTTAHDWLGHNVFLTREEAEAKLRKSEEV